MRWGLVLSGGAAYGLANIGVLQILEQRGLRPDCLAGSSMGAIVGAVYALGHSSETLRDLVNNINPLSMAAISAKPLEHGLHGGLLQHNIRGLLEEIVGDARIGDCAIPFVCVAGKIKEPIAWERIVLNGFVEHVRERVEPYIFPDDTRILDAVMASSAIPVLFSPVRVGDDTFIDLCNFGAIPARSLQARCHPDIIIATDTSTVYPHLRNFLPGTWKEFLDEAHAELQKSLDVCATVIRPNLHGATFRFDKAGEFITLGREAAEEQMPEILRVLGK